MIFGQLAPSCSDDMAGPCDLLIGASALHHVQGFEGRTRADALGPERAADKGGLCSLHDFTPADDGSDRIAVSHCLAKHRHIRLDAVKLVKTAQCLPES